MNEDDVIDVNAIWKRIDSLSPIPRFFARCFIVIACVVCVAAAAVVFFVGIYAMWKHG